MIEKKELFYIMRDHAGTVIHTAPSAVHVQTAREFGVHL